LGSALRRLLAGARAEKIIYTDVDLPFGVDVMPVLLAALNTADIAVASRYYGRKNAVPFKRKTVSRAYYHFVNFLLGCPVRDIGSGTVALKRNKVRALGLEARGFDIHAELYVRARQAGLLIKEIPADCFDDGRGSFRILRHAWPVVRDTAFLWKRLSGGKPGPAAAPAP